MTFYLEYKTARQVRLRVKEILCSNYSNEDKLCLLEELIKYD